MTERDEAFEAMCEVCGIDWQGEITQDQRGRVNAALKQLREIYPDDLTLPAMIRERAEAWAVVYPELVPVPSPQTLTTNWSSIISIAEQRLEQTRNTAKRKGANQQARSGCTTCGDDHWVIVGQDAAGADISAPCPDCNPNLDPSYWVQRERVQLMTGEQARKFLDT